MPSKVWRRVNSAFLHKPWITKYAIHSGGRCSVTWLSGNFSCIGSVWCPLHNTAVRMKRMCMKWMKSYVKIVASKALCVHSKCWCSLLYLSRGDKFQREYEGLVTSEAYVHAMAPATRLSRNEMMRTLGMDGALISSVSPHKKNILYLVKMKPDMEEFVQGLAESLCYLKSCMPRITIFHRVMWNMHRCIKCFSNILVKTSLNH